MTRLFTGRDLLRNARLGIASKPAKTWRGYGIQSGTNDKVYLEGTSQRDIEMQANGRAYRVKLMQIWQVPE